MATATTAVFEGRTCDVKVESDLDENWAVCILSGALDELSITRRPASPLIVKVRAKSRWTALEQGLKSMQAAGRITGYTIEPRPEAELLAIEAEKAKAAAKKVLGAKAAAEDA